ncbi:hypothetical protein SERLA73DRAFT_192164 [Serpula lacrymans var. lacrymans S7.3]|uniref:Thioredoxin domain-containing protein n=2 Tax=Serpula lacrymans var. lacrymans TaxID=341189 RepID=F8QJ50_SERL3|nr:uncharacterized protein SERLADRAFT_471754 [Serpula lacrymans var. lacrymans S7.9]EGN91670.1 hypothetical protein SERLA73DRAFT_192164 [Serpula lacrymans var. lacrymans S7.3]EGO23070.1 hypothetical protein SERLADRAFT_471754 [Serpula lacrymans var. lacrymans S7.9]
MTSIITGAAQAAHSAAASLLSTVQIEVGDPIPAKIVKEEDPERSFALDLKGKNIIVGVPGAFTPPCSSQVPKYIELYDKFKAKGVQNIYVVAINDAFVTKAWKEQLAPQGTGVRFIADDKGSFTGSLGLIFDASPLLGAPRSKRYVIVAQDERVDFLAVEEEPSSVKNTAAEIVLSQL